MKRRYRRLIRLVESPIVMHHLSSHSLEKMRTIYFLLSLCVYTICEVSLQSAAGIVPTVQLLPEGFSALRDYEVLSVHQEADEDVVRIRKRAEEQDCGSDCLNYSGWTDSGFMECDEESQDTDSEERLEKRYRLQRRGRKPPMLYVYPSNRISIIKLTSFSACDKISIDNTEQDGFYMISPAWPDTNILERERIAVLHISWDGY
jgi:hypothetical protein